MDDHSELTAAYALDALDQHERERYEAHLGTCEECREDLASFWAVSGALAHAAGGPPPPPALRERILEQARAERPNVVPFRPRRVFSPAAAVAAVAAVLALGFGLWGAALSRELDDANRERAVLGDPNARTVETPGGEADLIVTPAGMAALVVRSLTPAPAGKDYEIWVWEDGAPRRAGLFDRPGVALLTRPVEVGQKVAVTLEVEGGVDTPTSPPLFQTSSA